MPVPTAVSTPALSAELFTDRVWERAVWLANELSPRESATSEELAAARFLADEFSDWGYTVELQEFDTFYLFDATHFGVFTENVFGPNVQYVRRVGGVTSVFNLPLDPASLGSENMVVKGSLAYAGLAAPADLEGVDLDGKIALIERGGLTLADKVDAAAQAGAEAAVIFNNAEGDEYFWGRLLRDVAIPAIGITRNQGIELAEAVNSGRVVEVELSRLAQDASLSRNVVAELNNEVYDDEVVVIGAHLDTTPFTQGANDNGSGIAVASILAQELADDALPFDLVFVLFGAEETGLNGSYHYVRELALGERARVRAMINLDVVGTGDISAAGSEEMRDLVGQVAETIGIDLTVNEEHELIGSDHVAFLQAGIDTLLLFADDHTYINSPDDTLARLEAEPMGQAAAIAMRIIERLAAEPRR